MSRIKGKDTSLELFVRRYLFSRGYRYRIHVKMLGKPDIVFPKKKLAIFINGCFWHLHGCKLSTIPTTRREYWITKLERNKSRDEEVQLKLRNEGWSIIVLWECELEYNPDERFSQLIKRLPK